METLVSNLGEYYLSGLQFLVVRIIILWNAGYVVNVVTATGKWKSLKCASLPGSIELWFSISELLWKQQGWWNKRGLIRFCRDELQSSEALAALISSYQSTSSVFWSLGKDAGAHPLKLQTVDSHTSSLWTASLFHWLLKASQRSIPTFERFE